MMKTCIECGLDKPLSAFYFRKDSGKHRPKCTVCCQAKFAEYHAKNRDTVTARKRAHLAANADRINAGRKLAYVAAPERYSEAHKKWRAKNVAHDVARKKRYYERNKPAFYAAVARRTAAKLQATPAWANHFFIEEAYRLAQLRTEMFGFSWHVDHIVPLRSKLVCGLHTEQNLRVIPGTDNLSKGNRHWPDMPGVK